MSSHWLANFLGFLFILTAVRFLRGKPRTVRLQVAAALAVFVVACCAALYFLP